MAGEVLAVGAIGAGEPLREPLGVLLDPQQEEGALRVFAKDALLGRGERAGVTAREFGDVGGVELEPGGAAAARGLEADGQGPPADLEMQAGAEVEVAGGAALAGELLEVLGEAGEDRSRIGAEDHARDGEDAIVDPFDGDAELVAREGQVGGRGGDEGRLEHAALDGEVGGERRPVGADQPDGAEAEPQRGGGRVPVAAGGADKPDVPIIPRQPGDRAHRGGGELALGDAQAGAFGEVDQARQRGAGG